MTAWTGDNSPNFHKVNVDDEVIGNDVVRNEREKWTSQQRRPKPHGKGGLPPLTGGFLTLAVWGLVPRASERQPKRQHSQDQWLSDCKTGYGGSCKLAGSRGDQRDESSSAVSPPQPPDTPSTHQPMFLDWGCDLNAKRGLRRRATGLAWYAKRTPAAAPGSGV